MASLYRRGYKVIGYKEENMVKSNVMEQQSDIVPWGAEEQRDEEIETTETVGDWSEEVVEIVWDDLDQDMVIRHEGTIKIAKETEHQNKWGWRNLILPVMFANICSLVSED